MTGFDPNDDTDPMFIAAFDFDDDDEGFTEEAADNYVLSGQSGFHGDSPSYADDEIIHDTANDQFTLTWDSMAERIYGPEKKTLADCERSNRSGMSMPT